MSTRTENSGQREPYGVRLGKALAQNGPLCVGIDAHPQIMNAWGLPQSPAGLLRLSMTVIEALAGRVAAIKPQVAWYEAYGSSGIAVLEQTLAAAREAGVLSIADAKRGDIGSTMQAYGYTWLSDDSALAADAVTLSPYLGVDSLTPAFELAEATGRGTYVLALTSNPEGLSVQRAGGSRPVAAQVVNAVERRNACRQDTPENKRNQIVIKSHGIVVGATVGSSLRDAGVSLAGFTGSILAPGYGAQGATISALSEAFAQVRGKILVNSARAVLREGPTVSGLRRAAEAATHKLTPVVAIT